MITRYKGEEHGAYFDKALEWANEKVFKNLPDDVTTWVAGGAPLSYFRNETPTDFDLWFASAEDFNKTVSQLSNTGWQMTHSTDARVVFKQHPNGIYFDLIRSSYFESGEDVIAHFDFTVSSIAIGREEISYHEDFFEHIATGTLAIHNYSRPVGSFLRLPKYVKKGFTPDNDTMQQLFEKLHEVDIQDPQENVFKYREQNAATYSVIGQPNNPSGIVMPVMNVGSPLSPTTKSKMPVRVYPKKKSHIKTVVENLFSGDHY